MENSNYENTLKDAKQHLLDGEVDKAEEVYLKILQSSENNPVAVHGLATIRILQDRHEEAKKIYQTALLFDANQPLLLSGLGTVYLVENKLTEAVEYFERALLIDPTLIDSRLNLVSALYLSNEHAAAQKSLQILMDAAPDDKRVVAASNLLNAESKASADLQMHGKVESAHLANKARFFDEQKDLMALIDRISVGEIKIFFDYKKLSDASSPVSIDFLSTIILYSGMAFAAYLFYVTDPMWAVIILLSSFIAYRLWALPIQRRVAHKIILRQTSESPEIWNRLWGYGGVKLCIVAKSKTINAPTDDWREAL